ncbi:MAG: hypothetical protein SWH61_00600 [Thermodesulfobacteriota bacterium]|nr:hypothetical protein [Thermodesulfobacteriota bacterium]
MAIPQINKPAAAYSATAGRISPNPGNRDFAGIMASENAAVSRKRHTQAKSDAICLGTISKARPTVSHLLVANPGYRKNCWQIVHSSLNRDKPYTRIPENTAIYMHPQTREIFWDYVSEPVDGVDRTVVANLRAADYADKEDALFQQQLVSAVRAYRGQPYEMLDCYELLVQGLKDLGIQYNGKGGLKEVLMGRARAEGAPINRYLSGEGLIQAVGRHAYARSFTDIADIKTILDKIKLEIQPLLKEGGVLSFSTPSRGHTGVIGRGDEDWLFVNSGRLDHDNRHGIFNGVGEESLDAEIENWLQRAAKNEEPLWVTLGMIDKNKLMPFWGIQPG